MTDLDRLQAMCDAATRGPWSHDSKREMDAAFLEACREAVPDLIRRVREAELDAVQSNLHRDTAGRRWEQVQELESRLAALQEAGRKVVELVRSHTYWTAAQGRHAGRDGVLLGELDAFAALLDNPRRTEL